MKKLETITKEQEDYIPVLRKEWEDAFYKNEGIDMKAATEGVGWLYEKYLKLPAPIVMRAHSPLEAQMLIYILRANLWANLEDNFRDNLRENLADNLEDNLWDNLWANLEANLWANLEANLRDNLRENLAANLRDNLADNLADNLWANLRDNLEANLRDNLRDNLGANLAANLRDNLGDNYERPSYWANIGDYGWVSFYDFIQKTGHFKDYDFSDFDRYKSLLKSGIYEITVFKGLCVVCEMPRVRQDGNNQLHNVNGPAAQWPDGFGMYFVNGRYVEPRLVVESFTKEDLIKEENEDKKAAMITIIKERDGDLGLLKFLEAECVDSKVIDHFDGYSETVKLHKTKEVFPFLQDRNGNMGQPYCWSEIICPSTGATYLIDNSADFTDAEEAVKFLRPSFVPEELLYQWEKFAN